MTVKKSLFGYDDYRAFLKDTYLSLKEKNRKFSFRFFSKAAGFKSPNILKLVMDGERNLAPESAEKFAAAFKLGKEETVFFKNLVHFNQASNSGEKQKYAQQLMKSRAYRKTHPLNDSQYRYFAQWYFVLIRELIGLPGFKEDYDWITKQILYPITPAEAKKAVAELIKLGLIERNAAGNLFQVNANVGTPNEVTASFIAHCHRELMKRASESIDIVPREERDISSVTFTVSKKAAAQIKEKIQNFRKELLEVASQDNQPDSVYQLNFQFFPLAHAANPGEKK